MKAVILAGGLGTRLREETVFRPKPMVEIGDEPMLWHIMKIYSAFGITDFIICLGYKGEMVKDYFLNYDVRKCDLRLHLGSRQREFLQERHDESDWRVTLVNTGLSTMTGGRLLRIRHLIGDEPFLATYGDGVADIDVGKLLSTHRRRRRIATVTAVRPSSRFGELTIRGGAVQAFSEKPQVGSGWINGGFFVFEPALFSYLTGDECVLEREPLERLAAEGQLTAHTHTGFWRCVDTQRDMEALNAEWAAGEAPWKVWDRPAAPAAKHRRVARREVTHVVD